MDSVKEIEVYKSNTIYLNTDSSMYFYYDDDRDKLVFDTIEGVHESIDNE